MKKSSLLVMMVVAAGCSTPKVLVDHSFLGKTRTAKTLIQRTGSSFGSNKNKSELFNLHMEVCSFDPSHNEGRCKDTLVLENVVPRSIY